MNINEFKNNVDLYSADLSRWPVDMIKTATAIIASNAEAKAYFDAALVMDDFLRKADDTALKSYPALEDKIMKMIGETAQEEQKADMFTFNPARMAAPAGGGLLLVALIGFLIGFNPTAQASYVLDPVYYAQNDIIAGDADDNADVGAGEF